MASNSQAIADLKNAVEEHSTVIKEVVTKLNTPTTGGAPDISAGVESAAASLRESTAALKEALTPATTPTAPVVPATEAPATTGVDAPAENIDSGTSPTVVDTPITEA